MGDRIDILDHVPVRDARYCKKLMKDLGVKVDTEEVLLSRKGLIDFCSMSHMVCLEVLWLNDNNITKIKGLDTNVQLKCLYLHNNRINTLVGSLKYLKHILTLTLNNNRLQDLEATLPLISHITRLEDLGMSPCMPMRMSLRTPTKNKPSRTTSLSPSFVLNSSSCFDAPLGDNDDSNLSSCDAIVVSGYAAIRNVGSSCAAAVADQKISSLSLSLSLPPSLPPSLPLLPQICRAIPWPTR